MSTGNAFLHAIQIQSVPSQIKFLRTQPLGSDVHALLDFAVNGTVPDLDRIGLGNRSLLDLHQAAEFYIDQILLHDRSDAYRTLGVLPSASYEEIRSNMALLMKWVHPDGSGSVGRENIAQQVSHAWNALKTAERRNAYDRQIGRARPSAPAQERTSSSRQTNVPITYAKPTIQPSTPFWRKWLRRALAGSFVIIVLFFLIQPTVMMSYAENQIGNLSGFIGRYVSKSPH